MNIGIPKEIKPQENRVAIQPGGVMTLVQQGHKVMVEKDAGLGSGFSDVEYMAAGAQIESDVDALWAAADMIMKVKEPIAEEYSRIKAGQILFTYFHFAADKTLTQVIIDSKCIAIAYETVEKVDRSLPLLIPMSEVAGRMATQEGAKFLEKAMGGRGVLMGGIPGVPPANTLVLGGGIVGVNAAKIAAGMGSNTTIMDINMPKLRYLDDVMPKNITTLFSSEANIRAMLPTVDLIIGAVLKPGAKAPHLITREMLSHMRPGTVLVDVAIDQGGCFETTHPTTHKEPTYIINNVLHYCVANIPGAVPVTSTEALTNATISRGLAIANKGWIGACKDDLSLKLGLNIISGKIVYKAVADAFNFDYTEIDKIIL